MGTAAARWAELQQGRGIPPEILERAAAPPWVHDPQDFAAPAAPTDTPSRRVALELLGGGADARSACAPRGADTRSACAPRGGTVLDVGCGGGDASLALAGAVSHITAVDQQADMLEVFAADATARGIPYRTVPGRWPDVAQDAGTADLVISHHVLHNVVDLPPFLRALTAAARRGVVVEMLAEHPMAWLDALWVRFHDLHRPRPATTDDAVAVLTELGLAPQVQRWERRSPPKQDAEWITRRLCLPADRVDEVAAALADVPPRPRHAATLTWGGR